MNPLSRIKNEKSKFFRWHLKFEEFDYEIIHKKGKLNNAESFSWIEIYTKEIQELKNLQDQDLGTLSMYNNPTKYNERDIQDETVIINKSYFSPKKSKLKAQYWERSHWIRTLNFQFQFRKDPWIISSIELWLVL